MPYVAESSNRYIFCMMKCALAIQKFNCMEIYSLFVNISNKINVINLTVPFCFLKT
jgi:hypothetical protein